MVCSVGSVYSRCSTQYVAGMPKQIEYRFLGMRGRHKYLAMAGRHCMYGGVYTKRVLTGLRLSLRLAGSRLCRIMCCYAVLCYVVLCEVVLCAVGLFSARVGYMVPVLCVRRCVYRDYAEHGEAYECVNAVVGSGSDGAMRIWSSAGL